MSFDDDPRPYNDDGAEYLTSGAEVQPRAGRRKGRVVAIGAAAALVAGVGIGGVYAASQLRGGGAQPSAFIPATAVAYAAVDLDPSAGQKLGAIRFARKFPQVAAKLREDGDPREALFNAAKEDGDALANGNWDRDVKPWLGQRVGVGVLPPSAGSAAGAEPDVVVAIQVTDESKARDGLGTLLHAEDDGTGIVVHDGYAVIAKDQASAERLSKAAQGASLEDAADFRADMDSLGNRGIGVAWADVARVGTLVSESALASGAWSHGASSDALKKAAEDVSGRVVSALRFAGDDLELVADAHEMKATEAYGGEAAVDLGSLPSSTVAAFGFAHGRDAVNEGWKRADEQFKGLGAAGFDLSILADQVQQQTGLELPTDLATLLGDETVVSLDKAGLPDQPTAGVRLTTDASKAQAILDRLTSSLEASGMEFPLTRQRTDDGVVLATTPEYAKTLAGHGTLGDSDRFKAALPDAKDADAALYVDLKSVKNAADARLDEQERASLEHLSAAGLSVSSDGKGASHLVLRVVTD